MSRIKTVSALEAIYGQPGEAFAWMEGVLVLATLAQHWRATLVPDRPVELLPAITLRPKCGLQVTLHQRN